MSLELFNQLEQKVQNAVETIEMLKMEAEELRDDQFYDEGGRLGTLPPHTPQKEGSLLGEEFTSPHSVKKGD